MNDCRSEMSPVNNSDSEFRVRNVNGRAVLTDMTVVVFFLLFFGNLCIHTFQKGHQGDFPFISGRFIKMYRIIRIQMKILHSDERNFKILAKSGIF